MAMATPGSVSEMSRRTRATEPTAPVASAESRSTSLGCTRPATCEFVAAVTSLTTSRPTSHPTAMAARPPHARRRSEWTRFDRSASTTESMVPRIGVIRGATIIAPMTVAVESAAMPAAAMIEASTMRIQNRLKRPRTSGPSKNTVSCMRWVETTNGDGFGLGWYTPETETPAVFRSIEPAWNDRNLREVASHLPSPLFLAHIRASTGTAVQQTNCHPFRHGKWLWVHNGLVRYFHSIKRELALAVDE